MRWDWRTSSSAAIPASNASTVARSLSLSLAPILPRRLRDRALASQLVIDESTAMARAEDDPSEARRAFLATGVSVWMFWNAGTLTGALLGAGLGDPRALGLDARVPALAVAAVLVWRRTPFLVVVLAAAGTAALPRALSGW
jgi:predicted branched-subunit amino acid permease